MAINTQNLLFFACILIYVSEAIIYPGTKWCGAGDKAKNYSDLGRARGTDLCCRSHDQCPNTIGGFRRKWGLFNRKIYTIVDCKCDNAFFRCLKRDTSANSGTTSRRVGKTFFNILKTPCFNLRRSSYKYNAKLDSRLVRRF